MNPEVLRSVTWYVEVDTNKRTERRRFDTPEAARAWLDGTLADVDDPLSLLSPPKGDRGSAPSTPR